MSLGVGRHAVAHDDRCRRNDKIEIVYHNSLAPNFSIYSAEGLHDGATDIDDGEKFTQAVHLGQVVGNPFRFLRAVNQLSIGDDGYGFRVLVMNPKIFNDRWVPLQRIDQCVGIEQEHQNTTSGLSTGCLDRRISETISSAFRESSQLPQISRKCQDRTKTIAPTLPKAASAAGRVCPPPSCSRTQRFLGTKLKSAWLA
jgi:hypothetical protein